MSNYDTYLNNRIKARLKELVHTSCSDALKERRCFIPDRFARCDYRRIAEKEILYEALEHMGLARINMEPDDDWSIEDLEGEMFDPRVNTDINPNTLKKEQASYRRRVNEEGVHAAVLEVRNDIGEPFQEIECVGGFVGDDFYGSGCDDDFRAAAIDAVLDPIRQSVGYSLFPLTDVETVSLLIENHMEAA